jgi:diapolycopene oxygenase
MSSQIPPARTALVVGAGLGGIGAAVSLAGAGWKVHVFEKNEHVGGKLNLLQRDGFRFDLGPSILTLPHVFERLFERANKRFSDYVTIRHVFPHWRNFFEDGTTLDLYPTAEETVEHSPSLGPRDAQDMARFLRHAGRIYRRYERSYFELGLDTVWEMIRHHDSRPSLVDLTLLSTVHRGVARRIRNPHLVAVLDFFIKYVGSSAYDAPGVLNLLPHVQSAFGLWYVEGGLYQLALGLRRLMEDLGISLHLQSEVVEIACEGDKAIGIRTADGSLRRGECVVCNMEVIPAHRRLLGESEDQLRRFRKFEPSCSGLVLHLGVDREYPHLAHHNFLFSRNSKEHFKSVFRRKQLPEDPTIYLVAPMRTDPSQGPAGCENLKILPHIPYIQEPPFPPEAYARLKDRVLDKLERMGLVDLRRHIICEQMWVPEDIEQLYYSNRGAIYGVVSDRWRNLGFKAPKRSDRFANLYFVGGSVNPGGGMPMALLSGQQVADRILDGAPG